MLKHIIYVATFSTILLASNSALAFQTQYDTGVCRKELAEFNYEASYTNMLLLNADQDTHPISGFLRHDDVFDKRIFVRAYAAEGSDAFYELPSDATEADCRRLEEKLSKGLGWLAQYVIDRDPDRCRKYGVCD